MLTEQDLLYFEGKLEEKKKEILMRMPSRMPHTDTDELSDEVDLATIVAQQNFAEQMLERDKAVLKEVDDALKRIAEGEYGYCEGSGEEISRNRLEVQPWCRYTVLHQEKLEKMMKRTGRGFTDE